MNQHLEIPLKILYVCIVFIYCTARAEVVFKLLKESGLRQNLIQNGDFEKISPPTGNQPQKDLPSGWSIAKDGCSTRAGEGRNNSRALYVKSNSEQSWCGASQTLSLNRSEPIPIIVEGFSKSENVSGSSDSGYSLYVDIIYSDGTPLWGRTGNFSAGTHGWEKRSFVIFPEKPVKSLTLHCIFRGHTGRAWFDDVRVEELTTAKGALFQGTAIELPSAINPQPCGEFTHKTSDGLQVRWNNETIERIAVNGEEITGNAHSGFIARDVATDSHWYGFKDKKCPELGLEVDYKMVPAQDRIEITGRLLNKTDKDRAITLVFGLPIKQANWVWAEDIRRSRKAQGKSDFWKIVSIDCGSTGSMSLYPLGAIYNDKCGLAIAIVPSKPAVYRIGYNPAAGLFYISYDFGLVNENDGSKEAVSPSFRFVIYQFDPRNGFRSAFAKYTTIFPEAFVVRAKEHGLWMPFTDVSKVEGWQDFGFKFHEGDNNVAFDDANGILTFPYLEPMTWWMPMPDDAPRTLQEALAIRDKLLNSGNTAQRRFALVTRLATMYNEKGEPALMFRREPWCRGAVWSLNPNPYLPGIEDGDNKNLNAATLHWNDNAKKRFLPNNPQGKIDGQYLDSLEGYVTANLNFRREHFRYTTVPLVFSRDTFKPALFKGLAVFEFTRWISQEVHKLSGLVFANGVPYRFTFLCPYLDVLGTETDWMRNGKYQPASDSQMSLWRTMSGAKPYLLLMNTDYDQFKPEYVEKYFQRAMFYGMFPGMFSHNASENPYWQNPRWYNRDRHLFKKYIPLIRAISEAGWQPVPQAKCNNEQIYIEQFGSKHKGTVYLTFYNDTENLQRGELFLDSELEKLPIEELFPGTAIKKTTTPIGIELFPQQTSVIAIKTTQK